MIRTRQVLGLLGVALLAVLVVTGTWLWFEYRPPLPGGDRQVVQVLHGTASQLLIPVVLAVLLLHLFDPASRRRWPGWMAAALVVLAASFTGFLLPWDQLALCAPSRSGPASAARPPCSTGTWRSS